MDVRKAEAEWDNHGAMNEAAKNAEWLLKCIEMREAAVALMKSYHDHLINENKHDNPNNKDVFKRLQKAVRDFNGLV